MYPLAPALYETCFSYHTYRGNYIIDNDKKSSIFTKADGLLLSGSTENLSCRIQLMQQPGAQFLDNLFCSDGTMG